jgi:ubiquinone/menaquinone biosynthesis C-methylase UbiE
MSTALLGEPVCGIDLPEVLDACCGTKMFWFDPKDNRVLFVDNRNESGFLTDKSMVNGVQYFEVKPDVVADFRELPFPSETFSLVVFDPPHLKSVGFSGFLAKQYGKLFSDWRDLITEGFSECFRVLKPNGTLIFKWSEYEIKVSEVLALTPEKPLFGNRAAGKSKTHWIVFMKPKV